MAVKGNYGPDPVVCIDIPPLFGADLAMGNPAQWPFSRAEGAPEGNIERLRARARLSTPVALDGGIALSHYGTCN